MFRTTIRTRLVQSYQPFMVRQRFLTQQRVFLQRSEKEMSAPEKKKTLMQKIKEEAVHYWHGAKLLGLEIKISSRLTYKMLQGTKLTRRENRQVTYKKTGR